MEKDTVNYLKHKVANALMTRHGWDRTNPLHKLEFDPQNPDSQYSMAFDDANIAVETFIASLLDLEDNVLDESPEVATSIPDSTVDTGEPTEVRHYSTNPAIIRSSSLFIFMDSGKGKPAHVGDVRDWLHAVEDAGLPDSTEIDGTLYLNYDTQL